MLFLMPLSYDRLAISIAGLISDLIWEKVFKNGPNKTCGRQSVKNFTWNVLEYFVPLLGTSVVISKIEVQVRLI